MTTSTTSLKSIEEKLYTVRRALERQAAHAPVDVSRAHSASAEALELVDAATRLRLTPYLPAHLRRFIAAEMRKAGWDATIEEWPR